MIGMSSGFWNPKAKYPNGLQFQMQPMPQPSLSMHPTGVQQLGKMTPVFPGGNQAQYPPISPSTDILTKHSLLPNQNTQVQPQVNSASSNNRRTGVGVLRRGIF